MRPIVLCLVSSCAGRAPTADADPHIDADPLLGAWTTSRDPDGDPLPCPLELEFFADGTVEANFLNDDSEEKMCSFARMPVERDDSARPARPGRFGRLKMGGQLSACIWRREGDLLQLACEDHEDPPQDLDSAFTLSRARVREVRGLAAIAGHWRGPSHWGDPPRLALQEDGRAEFMEQSCRARVGDDRIDLDCGREHAICLYRATPRRLTLRCGADGRAPDRIVDTTGPRWMDTVVFTREEAPR